jgi:hypothetical protein
MCDAHSDGFPGAGTLSGIGLQLLTGKLAILVKIRSCESTLNDAYANPELPYLMVQRLREALQSMLAGAADSHIRRREETQNQTDIDDAP